MGNAVEKTSCEESVHDTPSTSCDAEGETKQLFKYSRHWRNNFQTEFRNSCPLFEESSPNSKRLRSNGVHANEPVQESSSVPSVTKGIFEFSPNRSPYTRNRPIVSVRDQRSVDPSDLESIGDQRSIRNAHLKSISRNSDLISIAENADLKSVLRHSDFKSIAGNSDSKLIAVNSDFKSTAQTSRFQPSMQNYFVPVVENSSDSKTNIYTKSTVDDKKSAIDGGPITKAVINRGLKARFKSFSAWLLNEPSKDTSVSSVALFCPSRLSVATNRKRQSVAAVTTIANDRDEKKVKRNRVRFRCPDSHEGSEANDCCLRLTASLANSTSFPLGISGSLKRWSSLRASFSLGNVGSKLRREASQRSSLHIPSRSRASPVHGEGTRPSSAASLNSLPDGRTTWPIPWLEAIFYPEFPSKGAWNENSFKILGTIAKGAFGKVYRVSLRTNPDEIFAMKVQNKSDVIAQNAIQQIKDEVSIHHTFANYPFIAQLHCTWQSRPKLYIVLQYIGGYGDLYQLWRDEGPFNEDATTIWAAELAMAIDYMHSNGVIYRDLKMENIMLDDDGHVQLVDFGLAKWLYYGDRTSTICGTLQYMAPEVLRGEMYNHGVDWWSLGVLLHTLMAGTYPYSGGDSHTSVKIDDYVPPTSLSMEAQNLLSKLLKKDPNWRLRSFTVYKTQPFFKGITFDEIRNKTHHPFDYIPRMRRCNTCNRVSEEMEGLEESDLAMFQEEYDALKTFDSLCEDEKEDRR